MKNIYANPVESIKKDIYIIRNNINGMVYVGQTKNVAIRFRQHCKPSNLDNSLLGKAIKEYGKENFSYEVIERRVKNYDEREKYWIKYYNSITPFGYNILPGGSTPPVFRGEENSSCVLDNNNLKSLIAELKNTTESYNSLAKKYGISKKQVLRINHGISRFSCSETYPLRKTPNINGKLTEEDVLCILEMLKYTYLFDGEIAKQFGVEVHAISKINKGELHKIGGEIYPIRKWKSCGAQSPVTYEQVTEIINEIQNSTLSLRKISQKYNVDISIIKGINNGSYKKYRREEVVYPLRNF